MKKYLVLLAFSLSIFALIARGNEIVTTNVVVDSSVWSVIVNETWASGWVSPTTWKSVYGDPVLQSEANLEIKTGIVWPQTVRASVWVQNTLEESSAFRPPGGEMDGALILNGECFWGMNLKTEMRFIDIGSKDGARVGNWADNDRLRLQLRLERPFKTESKIHTVTPSLVYFNLEPVPYRSKVEGDSLSPQLDYEWKPLPWFRMKAGFGYMWDGGINGGVPAEVFAYWGGAGVRLCVKPFECWLNGGVQMFATIGYPSNRPDRDFSVTSLGVGTRF